MDQIVLTLANHDTKLKALNTYSYPQVLQLWLVHPYAGKPNNLAW